MFRGLGVLHGEHEAKRFTENNRSWYELVTGGELLPLYELLAEALSLMPDGRNKDALENALGAGFFTGAPLANRRTRYTQAHGINLRTLYRREASAVNELLFYIDRIIERERASRDSQHVPLSEAELRDRVVELERENERLRAELEAQNRRV